jgi:hypothetical protein
MKRQNKGVPTMKLRKLRIATGLGLLLSAVMLCATPVFAQELRHVAEVLMGTSSGTVSFGPVSAVPPLCSETTGGPGCTFVTATGEGATGKIVEGDNKGDTFTSTGDVTALLVFTPSGAHDPSGVSTGVCFNFVGTNHWVFEDGSTIDLNRQGSQCCAASSCSPHAAGPPLVTHVSTIITGGTGRFLGLKGAGERASDGSRTIEEQVWELPQDPEN